MLTREQLVGQHFLPVEEVKVRALKGTVGVQGMTAGDALDYHKAVEKTAKDGDVNVESLAKLLVRCVVNDKRERVYSDDEWPEIMKWPYSALQTVSRVAMRLNNGSAEGN